MRHPTDVRSCSHILQLINYDSIAGVGDKSYILVLMAFFYEYSLFFLFLPKSKHAKSNSA